MNYALTEKSDPAPLSRRVTRKYSSGYAHLDQWDEIGTIALLASRESRSDDGDSLHQTLVIQYAGEALPVAEVKDALWDQFERGCRCQHDCCGHMQVIMGKCLHLGAGRYVVRLNGYRNV